MVTCFYYFEVDVARSQMFNLMSSRREMCTSSVSNVIYHKFSHGAAFYTLSGKNVNVMLEFEISYYRAPMRKGIRDNSGIIFLFLKKNKCCESQSSR